MFKKLHSVNWLVHELTMQSTVWLITSSFRPERYLST